MSLSDFARIPVVILCGGRGIFIDGSGQRTNKALVQIAGQPLVTHVMHRYVVAGFRHFMLAAGAQCTGLRAALCTALGPVSAGDRDNTKTKDANAPLRLRLAAQEITVTVIDTGDATMTGARLHRLIPFLGSPDWFCATYSDTVSDLDLTALVAAHHRHGRLATMVATQMPSRFRILGLRPGDTQVRGFLDKALIENDPINGGFYVFQGAVLGARYLGDPAPGLVLETTVLERLVEDRQLEAWPYGGGWHFLDSERDIPAVAALV